MPVRCGIYLGNNELMVRQLKVGRFSMSSPHLDVVKISDRGVFLFSFLDSDFGLRHNSYLIVDESAERRECVLIDPGSAFTFAELDAVLKEFMAPEDLKYVVLQHQDPDLCAAAPLLEKDYSNFQVVAHWRAGVLIKHYGISSPFYFVDQNDYRLLLQSGRKLLFYHTPYAHSPSAIMTCDPFSKVLFTSDLFGAFSARDQLYADEIYFPAMAVFHENYMPSGDILRLAAEKVDEVRLKYGIELIAPQHGALIKGEYIAASVSILKDLECGDYLAPLKKEMVSAAAAYRDVVGDVVQTGYSIFGKLRWQQVLERLGFLRADGSIEEKFFSESGLDSLLRAVLDEGGYLVAAGIKNRVLKKVNAYEIPVPEIYRDREYIRGEEELEIYRGVLGKVSSELDRLYSTASELREKVAKLSEDVERDPLTGLYNDYFMKGFMDRAWEGFIKGDISSFCLAAVTVDRIHEINERYGLSEGDAVVRWVGDVIREVLGEEHVAFRYRGAAFIIFLAGMGESESLSKMDFLRSYIASQNSIMFGITVSIGCASARRPETGSQDGGAASWLDVMEEALAGSREAVRMGGNRVVAGRVEEKNFPQKKALVADPDPLSRRIAARLLRGLGMETVEARDGVEAEEVMLKEDISLVIAEKLLPKRDGLQLLDFLRQNSVFAGVPVIFVSLSASPEDAAYALEKGAFDYLAKPVALPVLRQKIQRALEMGHVRG